MSYDILAQFQNAAKDLTSIFSRNELPEGLKNHTEEQLASGTHVHSFNDEITVKNWVHSIQRRFLDGRIVNDENTKFIIITGGHGEEDGRSLFSDWDLLERAFYKQDVYASKGLQAGTLNGLGPLRTKFELINLAKFHRDESGLVDAIKNAKLQNGENRIVLAFCHANAPGGDVKRVLKDNYL